MSQIKGTEPIRNTTEDWQDPTKQHLMTGLGRGGSEDLSTYVLGQEAAGQAQLVNSDRLPTQTSEGDEPYLALGFTFGEPDRSDPLFRPATLPPGWSRKATDHSMWSKLVDELGRERVAIFYKAAFYDRSAFMRLESPYGYLSSALYNKTPVVLDDAWLTREVAMAELEKIATREDEHAAQADEVAERENISDKEYWVEQAPKHRAEAAKARALAATL